MFGNLHIPGDPTTSQCDVFGGMFAPNGTNAWQVWRKPSKYSSLFIMCIGSGGGGGGGNTIGTTGGGGGGSSGIARVLYPMWAIPETLYVSVPFGGRGGPAQNNGEDGDFSLVSVYPHRTAAQDRLVISGGASPAGGGATNGTGGGAGTTPSLSSYPLACFSMMLNTAGQAGSANNIALVVGTTTMLTGGSGGAPAGPGTGAAITAPANTPYVTSLGGSSSNTTGYGSSGHRQLSLFMGGTGGGHGATLGFVGGSCGITTPGCGGGGGAGDANAAGGGDGGPGLVLLIAF